MVSDKKVHFKMYKSGKSWLVAGIAIASIFGSTLALGNDKVSADTNQTSTTTQESSASSSTNSTNVVLSGSADNTAATSTSTASASSASSSAVSTDAVSSATNDSSSASAFSASLSASSASQATSSASTSVTSSGSTVQSDSGVTNSSASVASESSSNDSNVVEVDLGNTTQETIDSTKDTIASSNTDNSSLLVTGALATSESDDTSDTPQDGSLTVTEPMPAGFTVTSGTTADDSGRNPDGKYSTASTGEDATEHTILEVASVTRTSAYDSGGRLTTTSKINNYLEITTTTDEDGNQNSIVAHFITTTGQDTATTIADGASAEIGGYWEVYNDDGSIDVEKSSDVPKVSQGITSNADFISDGIIVIYSIYQTKGATNGSTPQTFKDTAGTLSTNYNVYTNEFMPKVNYVYQTTQYVESFPDTNNTSGTDEVNVTDVVTGQDIDEVVQKGQAGEEYDTADPVDIDGFITPTAADDNNGEGVLSPFTSDGQVLKVLVRNSTAEYVITYTVVDIANGVLSYTITSPDDETTVYSSGTLTGEGASTNGNTTPATASSGTTTTVVSPFIPQTSNIVYTYEPKTTTVSFQHILEGTDDELADDTTGSNSAYYTENYAVSSVNDSDFNITGYHIVGYDLGDGVEQAYSSGDITKLIGLNDVADGSSGITIKLFYAADNETVTVKHVDESGSPISEVSDTTITDVFKYGDTITNAKLSTADENYNPSDYILMSTDINQQVSTGSNIVTLTYADAYNFTVNYVDQNGESINDPSLPQMARYQVTVQ